MADPNSLAAQGWGPHKVRFVTPDQYRAGLPDSIHEGLIKSVIVAALANAADPEGMIRDLRRPDFYQRHVTDVLREADDAADWTLKYDRFTAMALQDVMYELCEAGLLATRGNGDSVDYRLALPVIEEATPR